MCLYWSIYSLAPVVITLLVGVGLFVLYGWSLSNNHIDKLPSWPFISDLEISEPERSVFSFISIWGIILLLFSIFLYYLYVRQISGRIKTNKIGLIFGIISCVGCSLVVSFSVEEIPFIHYLGSALTFAGMTVYIWTICSLNYNVTQRSTSCIVIFRVTIALLQTFSLILFIIFGALFKREITSKSLAASCEWFMIYFIIIFIASLSYELCKIEKCEFEVDVRHDALFGDVRSSNGSSSSSRSSSSSTSSEDNETTRLCAVTSE